MSWLRKGSSLIRNISQNARLGGDGEGASSSAPRIDSRAALDSFKAHWLQAFEIMQRKTCPPNSPSSHQSADHLTITGDDVTTIVNHIDQMITLLIQESQGMTRAIEVPNDNGKFNSTHSMSGSPLLDFLLMESMLDKLLTWSINVGEFTNVMKLEQLKLYELLVSQLCHQTALFQKPLVRPLLQLLATCGDCAPFEVEKRLVILLNSLCVCLSQNPQLLELFFMPKMQGNSFLSPSLDASSNSSPHLRAKFASIDKPESRFLIFSLLIPFVHREGPIGQQARDALLLIMSMSRKHESVGQYIAENSNFCPVLATGLSGLYSSLPRKLSNEVQQSEDWHQLTPEDIQETMELQMFLNSLEFCNAVVQVSHKLVQQQLLEYVYQGFLVSVIGPALEQDTLCTSLDVLETNPKYSNTLEEMIATTAYIELFLRTVTEPVLIQVFLKFLITEKFDDQRILNTLIQRINGFSKLGLITLVLFRTMVDLSCEDVMLELIFRHLLPCRHLSGNQVEQKKIIDDVSLFDTYAEEFLALIPTCCYSSTSSGLPAPIPSHFNLDSLDSMASSNLSSGSNDDMSLSPVFARPFTSTIFILHNYIDYLNDAHFTIYNTAQATTSWSLKYDAPQSVLSPSSSEHTFSDSGIYMINNANNSANDRFSPNEASSQVSSPGSDSEQASKGNHVNGQFNDEESPVIGLFLHTLLLRLENMIENDVYSNLQLTGLISRLAAFPQPLLRTFLLSNKFSFVPGVKSLWEVLADLQSKVDSLSKDVSRFDELLSRARQFFNAREERLLSCNSPVRYFRDQLNSPEPRRNSNASAASAEVFLNIDIPKDKRRKSIKSFLGFRQRTSSSASHSSEPRQLVPVLESVDKGYKFNNRNQNNSNGGDPDHDKEQAAVIRYQNVVLAALVLEEFLKELSAISQEHFVFEACNFAIKS